MISVIEAQQKFAEILAADPSWEPLKYSQFSKHVAIFCAWALRDAQFKAERDRQEFFLSTALNKSSIQAHAEDREYIPRKAVPSSGAITVANSGTTDIYIPTGIEFITSTGTYITTTESKTAVAGGSVSISADQKEKKVYIYSIDTAKEFFECLIPLENTPKIAGFTVTVKDSLNEETTWAYYRLLQNTYPTTKAYDEFYSHTGQVGIRFGNGNFGLIPESGSTVTISAWETEGDVYIASGQKLYPVVALSSEDVAKVTVSTAFSGGKASEDIESIRANLHYWQTYNEELIWAEDYKYFLRRKFPEILFAKAWGEQEQEAQEGEPSLDYVNKIYISAYEPGTDIHTQYMAELEKVRPLNRSFEWVEVNHVQWTVEVTGTVLEDIATADAIANIKAALLAAYGKDSSTRRETVYTSEIYEVIMATGYFEAKTGARFSLTTSGSTTPTLLQDMVSIDIDNSTFTITNV